MFLIIDNAWTTHHVIFHLEKNEFIFKPLKFHITKKKKIKNDPNYSLYCIFGENMGTYQNINIITNGTLSFNFYIS